MDERTEKMLVEALKKANTGTTVIVVLPDATDVRPASLYLISEEYGGLWDSKLCKYRTKSGGLIYLMSSKNGAVVLSSMRVRGYDPENVFWDPNVLHMNFAKVIQEYHRYD